MTIDNPKITVVVPTYNERENLPVLVAQLNSLGIANLKVLVVDDNSPDGTGAVADQLAADSFGAVTVLHRQEKDGLGRAYVAGMTRALEESSDVVIQMDADLSHPVSAIPTMLDRIRTSEAALVIGSRYVAGGSTATEWPWHRKALSAWANFYVAAILGLRVKDATAGFKAWTAAALKQIDVASIGSDGYSFQVEMNHRAAQKNLKIMEVPIHFEERVEGASKMNLREQMESALTPWKLRFQK
ncbi:dolichol-phosphate mannosyltransferase [Paenarthrobacter nitroguajacolicus]|uniref:polyprenol monophosphomannose synthase n=1 Tax=Paenarthrobacter nitroguajacolicus TaxID=211146 RepID=UPI002858F16F|nr:polyprenol monophosphomannose synthase [Paenarthrobacter nitroguajacolicus]MDR6988452.1 dolichol-phosphate mannosyltransferase [Paenarthrobacter nitroguajacolicus]